MDEPRRSMWTEASTILDGRGQPARTPTTTACPRCGAGPESRVKSGMGDAHPVCPRCGYEWFEERWHD